MNNAIMPVLQSADLEAAIAFYTNLDFTVDFVLGDKAGKPVQAMLHTPDRLGLVMLELNKKFVRPVSDLGCFLYYTLNHGTDIDDVCQELKGKGVKIVGEIETKFYGDRLFSFIDLDGYRWTVAKHVFDFDLNNLPDGMINPKLINNKLVNSKELIGTNK
ncbi:MAG: VOC family protein [Candidatus Sericytochromatia bacterium]|nr:VOC family protein [Candidatus Sericytochromatia bacterium]